MTDGGPLQQACTTAGDGRASILSGDWICAIEGRQAADLEDNGAAMIAQRTRDGHSRASGGDCGRLCQC
jgi:hypothetical protein